MPEHERHDELISGISREYKGILEASKQGVYIYLDDTHKVCNRKFSDLLGYASPEEWSSITDSFPQVFVKAESQSRLISAYTKAMEEIVGSNNSISWKKKDGGFVDSAVILVPIAFENHLFALHFVTKQ
jgi:PAS domain-containing protein